MRKLSILTLVTAAAFSISGAAYAVDANVKAGVSGTAAMDSTSVETDATATGSVSSDNYGTLISTLNAGKGSVDLGSYTDADIEVVTLSSLKANGNTNALDNALKKNASAKSDLQASISGNEALKTKLDEKGVAIEDVIAVTTGADGALTVYVDDRG